jgi:hypothetical protein
MIEVTMIEVTASEIAPFVALRELPCIRSRPLCEIRRSVRRAIEVGALREVLLRRAGLQILLWSALLEILLGFALRKILMASCAAPFSARFSTGREVALRCGLRRGASRMAFRPATMSLPFFVTPAMIVLCKGRKRSAEGHRAGDQHGHR